MRPVSYVIGRLAIKSAVFHEIFHCLLETPSASMQIYIDPDARAAITRQSQDLSLRRRVVRVEASPHQHLFAVKRPAFDEHAVLVLTPNLIPQMICDLELKKIPVNTFVSEDWPRIFNAPPTIKVFPLRLVIRTEQ